MKIRGNIVPFVARASFNRDLRSIAKTGQVCESVEVCAALKAGCSRARGNKEQEASAKNQYEEAVKHIDLAPSWFSLKSFYSVTDPDSFLERLPADLEGDEEFVKIALASGISYMGTHGLLPVLSTSSYYLAAVCLWRIRKEKYEGKAIAVAKKELAADLGAVLHMNTGTVTQFLFDETKHEESNEKSITAAKKRRRVNKATGSSGKVNSKSKSNGEGSEMDQKPPAKIDNEVIDLAGLSSSEEETGGSSSGEEGDDAVDRKPAVKTDPGFDQRQEGEIRRIGYGDAVPDAAVAPDAVASYLEAAVPVVPTSQRGQQGPPNLGQMLMNLEGFLAMEYPSATTLPVRLALMEQKVGMKSEGPTLMGRMEFLWTFCGFALH